MRTEDTNHLSIDIDEMRQQFQAFYHATKKLVWSILWLRLGSDTEKEELCQEAYLKAWRGWGKRRVHGTGADILWISRITHNVVNRYLSERQAADTRISVLDPPDEEAARDLWNAIHDPTARPEEILANNEAVRAIVQRCIAQLPEDDLTILLLKYQFDLSHEQIAEVLGISKGASRTRTHRAKERFKDVIEEVEGDPERIAAILQQIMECLEESILTCK